MNSYSDEIIKTKGSWLKEDDEAYESCKQLLLASLPNSSIGTISSLQIWEVDSDDIATRYTTLLSLLLDIINIITINRYERRSSELNKVSCFVSSKDLTFDNSIQSVLQNGYSFKHTNGRMLFSTGIIDETMFQTQINSEYTFILTEVAVGRSFVCDDTSKMVQVPNGYDSFYIPPLPLDRNKDGEFSLSEYRAAACFDNRDPSLYSHKYVVLDTNQTYPMFLVKFIYNVYKPALYKDLAYEDVEYFDPILFKHVSAKERKNASTSRLLIPVQHAYEQAIKNLYISKTSKELFKQPDPLVEGKTKWIEKQFDTIDERIRLVNLNYAEETEKLTKAYNAAVEQLKNITREKLEIILSTEIDLRRDEEQIAWINSYVKRQRDEVIDSLDSPTLSGAEKNMARINFLKSLHYFSDFRNNWSKLKNTQRNMLGSISSDIDAIFDVKFIPRCESKGTSSTEIDDKSISHISIATNNRAKDLSVFMKNTATSKSKKLLVPTQVPLNSSLKKVIDMKTVQIKEAIAAAVNSKAFPLPPSIMQESSIIPSSSGSNYPMPIPFDFIKAENNQITKNFNVRKDYESQLFNIVGSSRGAQKYEVDSDVTSAVSESTVYSRKAMMTPQKAKSSNGSVRGAPNTGSVKGASSNSKSKIETVGVTASASKPRRQSISVESLKQLTVSYKKFSLEVAAQRKLSQIKSQTNITKIPGLLALQNSNILNTKDVENLYFNLPFFSKVPDCVLLYSTAIHSRSLEEMYVRSMKHNGATFFIIRSGQFKFGAYLNQTINLSNGWTGSATCFLYSLTLDLKIPYQSKLKDDEMKIFFGQWEKVSIGDGDLILDQTLESGSSNLENSFGIGLKKGDYETQSLLAGSTQFTIDALEVWAVA